MPRSYGSQEEFPDFLHLNGVADGPRISRERAVLRNLPPHGGHHAGHVTPAAVGSMRWWVPPSNPGESLL